MQRIHLLLKTIKQFISIILLMVYEISRFRIVYYGKKSEYHTIQQISILANYIQLFGISSIRQIIFEFIAPPNFPHRYHNIVLCNTKEHSFVIQFYHYYNSCNQLVMLHENDQRQDFDKLIHFLYHHPILQHMLIPYIYPPFQTT